MVIEDEGKVSIQEEWAGPPDASQGPAISANAGSVIYVSNHLPL